LRGNGLVAEPLYDGILDLIETLDADGWLLGVATGKSDRGLGLCLEHHGLGSRFVTLQTADRHPSKPHRSEEHTSELQSLMRISYAVFCLNTQTQQPSFH